MDHETARIEDHCIRAPFFTVPEGYSLRSYFQKVIDTNLPFATVINSDCEFLGNVWATAMEKVITNIDLNRSIGEFLRLHPKISDLKYILDINDTFRKEEFAITDPRIFPVRDSKNRVVGYLDRMSIVFENVLPKLMSSNPGEIRTVLIVDDETMLTDAIGDSLQRRGYQVTCASNGQEALYIWRSRPDIQLIITDLDMPKMNGKTLISEVRSVNLDIPILVMTGKGDRQNTVECLRLGANDFHDKPFDIDILVHSIKRFERQVISKKKESHHRLRQLLIAQTGTLMADGFLSLDEKINQFCEKISDILNCRKSSVILYDKENELFVVKGSTNPVLRGRRLEAIEAPILCKVAEEQIAVITRRLVDLERFKVIDAKSTYDTASALVVPMVYSGQITGFITASDKNSAAGFEAFDLELIQSCIRPISLLFDYGRLVEKYETLNASLNQRVEEQVQKIVALKQEGEQYLKLALLGETAGSIAHDINNPLAIALAYTTKLEKLIGQNQVKAHGALKKLLLSLNRIHRIVNSMARMARAGSSAEATVPFDIGEAISVSLSMLERKILMNDVDLKIDCVNKLCVRGNQIQIEQVISNLVSNSIDAVGATDRREISVSVQASICGKRACVKITDSGPGIPEELKEKVFSKFVTTKERGKGTGLGLHISKTIIENHGGKITYSRENNLTSFVIEIPLLKQEKSIPERQAV